MDTETERALYLLNKAVGDLNNALNSKNTPTLPTPLSKEEVLKWCVENRPSFKSNAVAGKHPAGWMWDHAVGTLYKRLVNKTTSEGVTFYEVQMYVDAADITDGE